MVELSVEPVSPYQRVSTELGSGHKGLRFHVSLEAEEDDSKPRFQCERVLALFRDFQRRNVNIKAFKSM